MREEAQRLAEEYLEAPSDEKRNALVELLIPMVKRYAFKVSVRVRNRIHTDELLGSGFEAIAQTLTRYDASKGRYISFLSPRLHGSMMDYVRNLSGSRRTSRNGIMGYFADHVRIFPMSTLSRNEDGETVLDHHTAYTPPRYTEAEEAEYAETMIAVMPINEREREIMRVHYIEDLPLHQAAERLNLSNSRACQLHKQSLVRVRERYHARMTG